MILSRVVGDIVAPVKNEKLDGKKLLIVQPVDVDGKTDKGPSFVAVDLVQAGEGDLVLVNKEGGGARITLRDEASPVQSMVVAVVDEIELNRRPLAIDPPVRRIPGR